MPMPAYPTNYDLWTFLTGCGFTLPQQIDFTVEVEGAVEEWESGVGWFPFLNVKGDEAIVLDQSARGWGWGYGFGASGGFGTWRTSEPQVMDFECGILSVASIVIGHESNPSQILQEGRDYQMLPRNAPRQGWPYSHMRLTNNWYGYGLTSQEITIKAKCGFCHQVPTDVWKAILRHAAAAVAPQLSLSVNSGASSFKTDGVEMRFASGPKSGSILSIADEWDSKWDDRLSFYARRTI